MLYITMARMVEHFTHNFQGVDLAIDADFQTFESQSFSLPTNSRNSISALAVPRNGSSFGPRMLGRGKGCLVDIL